MNFITTTFEKLGTFIDDNTTTIMTGIGIGGFLAASYFVGKGVLKADRKLREAQEKNPEEEIETTEKVKIYALCLTPAIILIVGSTVIIIAASAIDAKSKAALGAMAVAGEQKYKEYKEKMKESLGVKKEKEISSEIYADKVHDIDTNVASIANTGKGNTLFYDCATGTLFYSSIDAVRKAVNELNAELIYRANRMNNGLDVDTDVYVNLNDFRQLLGLDEINIGKYIGHGLQDNGMFEIESPFTVIETADGKNCILLQYEMFPIAEKDWRQWD